MSDMNIEFVCTESDSSEACCVMCGAHVVTGTRFCRWCGHVVAGANPDDATEATTRRLQMPFDGRGRTIAAQRGTAENFGLTARPVRSTQPLMPLPMPSRRPRRRALFALSLAANCLMLVALSALLTQWHVTPPAEVAHLAMLAAPMPSEPSAPGVVQEESPREATEADYSALPETKAAPAARRAAQRVRRVVSRRANIVSECVVSQDRLKPHRRGRLDVPANVPDEGEIHRMVMAALRNADAALSRKRVAVLSKERSPAAFVSTPVMTKDMLPLHIEAGARWLEAPAASRLIFVAPETTQTALENTEF